MIIENFDDFYDHYQGFSAYVAFCITEDYELSKDISQEVFLALFKVKEKLDYSRPDKLKSLVMKATSNKFMDYYRIGMRMVDLCSLYLNNLQLKTEALPFLEELRAQTGMIVHLGTMDEGEVVYLEKISSFSNIRMYSQIGKRAYMHATGLGKAMLSGLSEKEVESIVHRRGLPAITEKTCTGYSELLQDLYVTKQRGYSIDDEENAYEPVDEKSNPEARILRMEEAKYQKLVLNRLRKRNPMNYDILVKTKFQELSAAEVASEYGITPNNVNNRNLRSKAWIIEEMEKICRQSHR